METKEEIRNEIAKKYKTRQGENILDWDNATSLYSTGAISDYTFEKIIDESMDEYVLKSQISNCCSVGYYLAPRMIDDKFVPHCSKCNNICEIKA